MFSQPPGEFIPDKPVLVTATCHGRQPLLADPARKALLLGVLRELRTTLPFSMVGYAILDDHFHWIFEPAQTGDVPLLVQSVKLRFVRRLGDGGEALRIWEPKYREQSIGEQELDGYLDAVHYDPVKHGLVMDPASHAWSSFNSFQSRGSYPRHWGIGAAPEGLREIE